MFAAAYASENTKHLYQTTEDEVDEPLTAVFRVGAVSHSKLTSLQANNDGKPPERKTWDFDLAKAGAAGFRLKAVKAADIEVQRQAKLERRKEKEYFMGKSSTKGEDELPAADTTADSAAGSRLDTAGGLSASSSAPALGSASTRLDQTQPSKKMSRAEKYYQSLLKAEWQRNERIRKEKETEEIAKAEAAAAAAQKAAMAAEKVEESSKSDSEAEEEEEEEIEAGPLVPYDGALRVEVEVVVMRAPGEKWSEKDSDSGRDSTATPTSSGSGSYIDDDDRVDLGKELQALQEELQKPEEEEVESEGSDGLPEGLRLRKIPANINDADDKRVALGLGGTAFFVPDVERYALAPSLLPPPPQSLAGRRRMRLKPRLPLEISRHRWRDEHPSIGADPQYSPDIGEKKSYEDKMCMVDLYAGVHQVMTRMPRPDGIRRPPPEKLFDLMLDKELRHSKAWKQHIKRERVMLVAAQQDRRAQDVIQTQTEKAGSKQPSPSITPPGAATPTSGTGGTGSNRVRGSDFRGGGSNPPSPPEAGGPGSSGTGLMGVAPGVRAGV